LAQKIQTPFVDDIDGGEAEIEANAFAAALLMPQEMVINCVKGYASQVSSRDELTSNLARVFDVSTEAMGFRLINLGILARYKLFVPSGKLLTDFEHAGSTRAVTGLALSFAAWQSGYGALRASRVSERGENRRH
jgi:Zn-dependent peptidase ImmA (M78 family)